MVRLHSRCSKWAPCASWHAFTRLDMFHVKNTTGFFEFLVQLRYRTFWRWRILGKRGHKFILHSSIRLRSHVSFKNENSLFAIKNHGDSYDTAQHRKLVLRFYAGNCCVCYHPRPLPYRVHAFLPTAAFYFCTAQSLNFGLRFNWITRYIWILLLKKKFSSKYSETSYHFTNKCNNSPAWFSIIPHPDQYFLSRFIEQTVELKMQHFFFKYFLRF